MTTAEYVAYTYDGETECGYNYGNTGFGSRPNCYPADHGEPREFYRLSGVEAAQKSWASEFGRLGDKEQDLILAVFPDIMSRDNLKPPKVIYKIAVAKIHKAGLTVICPRCGGTGHYSFNRIDGTRCFKCGGSKYVLPKITKKFLGQVRATMSQQGN